MLKTVKCFERPGCVHFRTIRLRFRTDSMKQYLPEQAVSKRHSPLPLLTLVHIYALFDAFHSIGPTVQRVMIFD